MNSVYETRTYNRYNQLNSHSQPLTATSLLHIFYRYKISAVPYNFYFFLNCWESDSKAEKLLTVSAKEQQQSQS
jgi:hypothetical protein